MRRFLVGLILATALFLPFHDLLSDTLTLDDVIVMSMSGESEENILKRIRQSESRFSLTAADLARLRECRVSERIVAALQATAVPPEPEEARFVPYATQDGRVGFDYPETWKPVASRWGMSTITPTGYEIAVVPREDKDDLSEIGRGFLIAYYREVWARGAPSLDEWEENYRQRMAKTDPAIKLERAGSRSLADREGMMYDLRGVPLGGGRKVRCLYWVSVDPGGVHVLGGSGPAENFENLIPTFERILTSVRFGGAAAPVPTPTPGPETGPKSGPKSGPPTQDLPSFLEFTDPDRTFRIRYPAGWSRANLVTKEGIFWFFSRSKFDPRSGRPFVGGISVFVRPSELTSATDRTSIAKVAQVVKEMFQKTQIELGSTVSVSEPEAVRLKDDPGVRFTYDLKYSNGDEERGYLVVGANPRAVVVAEANATLADFDAASPMLLASVLSLRVSVAEGSDRR